LPVKTTLSTFVLRIKTTKKARHASILKVVVAKNVWAYFSGFIFWVTNKATTTNMVRPVIKANITQKCGTKKLGLSANIKYAGGIAKRSTNIPKEIMADWIFNFLQI
jgi:hypothetical protein